MARCFHTAIRQYLVLAPSPPIGSVAPLLLSTLPSVAQGFQNQRAFSTDNSYSGQQIRIERLWREFLLGQAHWRTKEGPDEPLWIEDAGAKERVQGQEQSSGASGTHDSSPQYYYFFPRFD